MAGEESSQNPSDEYSDETARLWERYAANLPPDSPKEDKEKLNKDPKLATPEELTAEEDFNKVENSAESAEEQIAIQKVLDFLVDQLRQANESDHPEHVELTARRITIADLRVYFEVARTGNLFGDITRKFKKDGKEYEKYLGSVYGHLQMTLRDHQARTERAPESHRAMSSSIDEAEGAVAVWIQSKLKPGLTFRATRRTIAGELYIIATDKGNGEHNIPISHVMGREFEEIIATDSSPPESEIHNGRREDDSAEEESQADGFKFEVGQKVRVYNQDSKKYEEWRIKQRLTGKKESKYVAEDLSHASPDRLFKESTLERWQLHQETQPRPSNPDTEGENVPGNETADDEVFPDKFGEWLPDGSYRLAVEPEEISRLTNIPVDVIRSAAEAGEPVERLLQATTNPFVAGSLARIGINVEGWAAKRSEPREDERRDRNHRGRTPPKKPTDAEGNIKSIEDLTPQERQQYAQALDLYLTDDLRRALFEAEDPGFFAEAVRTRWLLKIDEKAERIERHPGSIKKELKRPGELPLQLHRLPFIGRRIGRTLLARRIYAQERKERKEQASEGEKWKTHEEGITGLGIKTTDEILEAIRTIDKQIKAYRNKLKWWNSHQYRGKDKKSTRRDLAESIEQILEQQRALEHLSLTPTGMITRQDYDKAIAEQVKRRAQQQPKEELDITEEQQRKLAAGELEDQELPPQSPAATPARDIDTIE